MAARVLFQRVSMLHRQATPDKPASAADLILLQRAVAPLAALAIGGLALAPATAFAEAPVGPKVRAAALSLCCAASCR